MPDNQGGKKSTAKKERTVYKPALEKKPQKYKWPFQKLPSISTVAVWEWNIAEGICRYSDEWTDIIGEDNHAAGEQNNWTWWSGRMHMDDMPGVLETHKQFFEGHFEESEIIYRLRRPDGRWVRILSRGVVTEWKEDGTPAIMSGLSFDISHVPMDPPLPEDGHSPQTARSPKSANSTDDTSIRNTTEQRLMLNERRLTALYQLAQMEKASEDELLHFAVSSILQLTGSASGFLFIPDLDIPGKGLFFRFREQSAQSDQLRERGDTLPEDLAYLATDAELLAGKSRIANGAEATPFLLRSSMPVTRYILAPGTEDGRTVCIAGVCNKSTDYDESDLQQVETFINNAWLTVQRRRRMLELELAKEAAEAADKAKGEFLANVSHELRTPLNGILSMLQLLEDASMTAQEREFLDTAHLSGKALVRIISDILDFSRIESGKMPLEKELFDFKASVSSSLRIFREEAEKRNLTFTTKMDPAIPDILRGDDTRVRQIIFNLVGNALKFTKQGGITVACTLTAPPRDAKAALLITVADTGIGIPKDKQNALFNAFTRVDTFFTKKHSGTGLGLSIVKRLVDMMEGSIHLDSEPGKGTSISCSIVLEVPDHIKKPTVTALPTGTLSQKRLDILVAEDDAIGRFAIRAFLLREGHRVVCVQDGRQALEALQLHSFDCLLTDIQMPDMDGLELARNIQENRAHEFPPSNTIRSLVREVFPDTPDTVIPVNPAIPIVAVSAHTMAGDRERFLQQGINHYIAKPIVMQQLNDILREISEQNGG
ncbi:MAG: Sensor histidine kinase RcsC [Desulfovibrio sp.]